MPARVVVVSPPFRSHAQPLSVLAAALREAGARVHLACAPAFEDLAEQAGVPFVPLTVTRNANTGIAERTEQDAAEAARLAEFLQATREGAVPALLTQARHRRADLLADPDGVRHDLAALHERLRPDWYVVDQLSYPVTLALYCLGLRWATFCPGHPGYLPAGPDAYFGVPTAWPEAVRPSAAERAELTAAAAHNDTVFTALFAATARRAAPHLPPPGRAFALCSSEAVLYNYPSLPWLRPGPAGPLPIHLGHCATPSPGPAPPLDAHWQGELDRLGKNGRPVVLVALGTFLSARSDVLRTVAEGLLDQQPELGVVVAAGDRSADLEGLAQTPGRADRLLVAPTVPQRQLLGHVAAMVHHGGNNSFTECLHAGVPALVLPFSSDQFSIAHDVERAGAGVCLDPNSLTPQAAGRAVASLLAAPPKGLAGLSAHSRSRGPAWAAPRLLAAMHPGGPPEPSPPS